LNMTKTTEINNMAAHRKDADMAKMMKIWFMFHHWWCFFFIVMLPVVCIILYLIQLQLMLVIQNYIDSDKIHAQIQRIRKKSKSKVNST
jgi:hypothetical protein